ncbi:hypothetical protein PTTG_29408 [Puccinia triticina 1-1 BBBD Race 1]|uniref:HECT-type E3 ubiquitin transferase n=1 Tax=Puccinia triticina (isolate 1-1 / race 1 (BBBD)) TaxID=630390 RepID=A0A180G4F0_PUCT1|nr:hypothetical protein PTTG_29408 [Puccinia triticina 1-1 BBBD Race 1]
MYALEMVELRLAKLPDNYNSIFWQEGVRIYIDICETPRSHGKSSIVLPNQPRRACTLPSRPKYQMSPLEVHDPNHTSLQHRACSTRTSFKFRLRLVVTAAVASIHRTLAGLDAMGISGLRGLGGIMAGFTHRLKNILQSLKARGSGSSTSQLVALQELVEILAVSTEDTLAGYFQTDSFARELVAILRGESDHHESKDEEDEVALVAALTATGSSSSSHNHPSSGTEVEQMLLASRCLANLMEALPGSAHTVVHHGAVPVLCAKLLEINFIDLAEQSLSTLEKISEELPSSIVWEGGLTALLQYLDFFSTNVQQTYSPSYAKYYRTQIKEFRNKLSLLSPASPTLTGIIPTSSSNC